MTELNLTLLTDEERRIYEHHTNPKEHLGQLSWGDVDHVFVALVAARAENKRKDEMLRILTAEMYPKVDTYGGGSSGAYAEFCIDDIDATCVLTNVDPKDAEAFVRVRTALLQSEKGGTK